VREWRLRQLGRSNVVVTRFASVLGRAREMGRAVGAFTCYNFEELEAVVRAAEARRAPAIVLVSPASFKSAGGERLVRGFRAAVAHASADVLLQLDHVSDLRSIERAVECGVDAVMADGSKLSFRDNLAFTSSVVSAARSRGIGVEAELGRVEGQEDRVGKALVGAMTEPEEAEEFAEKSEADCLAVAVGNVHGHYVGTPSLDWERLEEIQDLVPSPLSLHGASGLPNVDIRRVVSSEVAKMNVNTELRTAYFQCLEKELEPASEALDLIRLGDRLVEAVTEVVESRLDAFGWIGETSA
jgi:fructose-bisphosphate aldolase, class II